MNCGKIVMTTTSSGQFNGTSASTRRVAGGGHQRRPSLGKSMPISTLLLDFNGPSSYLQRIGDCKPSPVSLSGHHTEPDAAWLREMQQKFNMKDFRAKLQVAEALSQASMLTSPAARRRIAARQVELETSNSCFSADQHEQTGSRGEAAEHHDCAANYYSDESDGYVPPRELLIYLLR